MRSAARRDRRASRRATVVRRTPDAGQRLRRAAAGAGVARALPLAACLSPQVQLLLSLLPEGTSTTLLTNMRGVSEPNREKLAALEQKGDWNGIAEFAQATSRRDPQNPDCGS